MQERRRPDREAALVDLDEVNGIARFPDGLEDCGGRGDGWHYEAVEIARDVRDGGGHEHVVIRPEPAQFDDRVHFVPDGSMAV